METVANRHYTKLALPWVILCALSNRQLTIAAVSLLLAPVERIVVKKDHVPILHVDQMLNVAMKFSEEIMLRLFVYVKKGSLEIRIVRKVVMKKPNSNRLKTGSRAWLITKLIAWEKSGMMVAIILALAVKNWKFYAR